MNIITVIPLARSKMTDLSYFTASDVPVGAIVSVPVRSKSIHAIVSHSEPAEDLKSSIKNASYEIRKLGKVRAKAFFPATFMEACKVLSDYYATTVGAVIDALVSDTLLENSADIPPPLPAQTTLPAQAGFASTLPNRGEVYAVQGDDIDRITSWRSLIRQEFAKKKSIAFYVPTIEDAKSLFASLEKGIEGYIFMLNSSIPKKKITSVWTELSDTEHPIVVIATGSFSVLPRTDIDTVIIERENSRGWITAKAPYIDLRHAIETIASKRRQNVYVADSMLRTETLYRLDKDEIAQGSPFKWRSISNASDLLVDMTSYKSADNNFKIFSPELEQLIRHNQEENCHMFMLVARRGLSPITVCDDCETIVSCTNCSAPVVLHTSQETGKNFFMCHACGERRTADESCKNCGGWRLTPLGIGIDRVYEELKARFPTVEVLKIDSDSTTTDKQITDVIGKFRAKPGNILLGTEMALLHLNQRVDHTAVVSLDSLFALPDYKIQEKLMYNLIRLRTMSSQVFLVQTRRPEEKVFEYGLKGNLSDFYRNTLEERKQFRYPPFAQLIKITLEGKKQAISEEMAKVQKLLEPYEVDIFPAFTSTVKGNSIIHGLIKVEPGSWPEMDLVSRLRALPPSVTVKINPESLL